VGRFMRARTYWKERNYSIIEGESLAPLESLKQIEHQGITPEKSSIITETPYFCDGFEKCGGCNSQLTRRNLGI
jgi:hypothetical protein